MTFSILHNSHLRHLHIVHGGIISDEQQPNLHRESGGDQDQRAVRRISFSPRPYSQLQGSSLLLEYAGHNPVVCS